MKTSRYLENPMRPSAILKIDNDDKYCFHWSTLASLHPCENSHPNRVSKYREIFIEINIDGFYFSNGIRCIPSIYNYI